jgi:tetratricopeptide (TPR) repeat protein
VALVFTSLLFAVFLAVRSKRAKVRLGAGLAVLLLVLAGIGVYAVRDSEFIKSQNTLRRLATISPSDITTQSRFDTWRASFEGWSDRPILGYGYENYNIAFNQYFPARIFKDQGSQLWFDRAHNIVFDQLGSAGLVGLLAYLAILFSAFWFLFRLYRKSRRGDGDGSQIPWQMPLILSLALAAYFIQNIFVFDTQATYLMFFLLLAYISHLHTGNFGAGNEAGAPVRTWKPNWLIVGGLSAAMLVAVYFVNIEPALANRKTVQAIYAARTQQYRQVRPLFEQALSYGTYMDEEIRQRLIDFANEAVDSGQLSPQEQIGIYRFTIDELKKSIAGSPKDVKNYLYLITLYNRASRFDPGLTDAALDLAEQTIALSPTRPQIYFEIGQAYFNKDMPEKGLEFFQKAVDLNPEPKESHFNYAIASILAGREDLAEQKIQEIQGTLGFKLTASDHITLGRAYVQNNNHAKAVEHFREAIALDPVNIDFYARLVQEYGRVCDLASASQVLDELVSANPDLRGEADQFLVELRQNCGQ